MKPYVSVVLPTYNRAHCLRRAITGLLAQSFSDWELVLVDDGSTDDTFSIRKELESALSDRYREIVTTNVGASLARNLGIEASRGSWVAFLDSDDVWMPEKLSIQLEELERNKENELCFTDFFLFDDEIQVSNAQRFISGDLETTPYPAVFEIRHNVITCPSVVVRRDTLLDVGGFDNRMRICEDIDLWGRIARRSSFSAVRMPLTGVHWRKSEAFPYSASLRGRAALYRNAVSRDAELREGYRVTLLNEVLTTFRDVSLGRADEEVTDIFEKRMAGSPGVDGLNSDSLVEIISQIADEIDAQTKKPGQDNL